MMTGARLGRAERGSLHPEISSSRPDRTPYPYATHIRKLCAAVPARRHITRQCRAEIFGRRGITSGGLVGPVTLGYSRSDHQHPGVRVPGCPVSVRPGKSGASASPTEIPQLRDTAPDPHRNPTDGTAHSGTLVMRVKSTENSRSSASMRVSWAFGAFSR